MYMYVETVFRPAWGPIMSGLVRQEVDVACPAGAMFQQIGQRKLAVSLNYWKVLAPKHLVGMPRLPGLMCEIMADPSIHLDVVPSDTLASKILAHAQTVIQGLPAQCQFKIGQTLNPVHRWANAEYGYRHVCKPRWSCVRILAILAHGEAAGFLEAALISNWHADARCQNSARGGEAVSRQEGPCFVYVVVSP